MTESQTEEQKRQRAQVEERKKQRAQEDARLRGSVDAALRTEDGRRVFAHLFTICGYNNSSIVMNPRSGSIDLESTAYNEARRMVYLHMRKLASLPLLLAMEATAEEDERTERPAPAATEERK